MNVIFFVVIVVAILGAGFLWKQSKETPVSTSQSSEAVSKANGKTNNANAMKEQDGTTPTELEIVTTEEGTGTREVKSGDTIAVHYTGTLLDGTKFDSSLDRGEPFEFTIGQGQVIAGWDKGLLGMKVGEKRTLTIPSDMAYGSRGAGALIPPNSPLKFDVELISIK